MAAANPGSVMFVWDCKVARGNDRLGPPTLLVIDAREYLTLSILELKTEHLGGVGYLLAILVIDSREYQIFPFWNRNLGIFAILATLALLVIDHREYPIFQFWNRNPGTLVGWAPWLYLSLTLVNF